MENVEILLKEMRPRYETLEKRIQSSCEKCGRTRESVKLVWVSKFHPIEAVEAALLLGAKDFGENRVQEALTKFSEKRPGVRCHIIGPVQTNKLKQAAHVGDAIHSIASLKAVNKLEQVCSEHDKILDILFQVNTSEEDTKSGVSMADVKAFL